MDNEPIRIVGLDGFRARVGTELGVSAWHTVTQAEVTAFADVTGDRYWIHVDPQRAADSAFGGTIAHGFFTLSLAPAMMYAIYTAEGVAFGVNYGADRLRFPAPTPVGGRVRLRATLTAVAETADGFRTTSHLVFELEGGDKPACVLDWLGYYVTE